MEDKQNSESSEPLPMLLMDRDYEFFFRGLQEGRLLAQRCDECGKLRQPLGPMCPECNSFAWTAVEMPPTGTIYSFTVHRHPPLTDYETPHPVGLVEFDNGIRFLAPISDMPIDEIRIGRKVATRFRNVGRMPSFYFVPA